MNRELLTRLDMEADRLDVSRNTLLTVAVLRFLEGPEPIL